MRRIERWLALTGATLAATVFTLGCGQSEGLFDAELVEAAPSLTPEGLLSGLDLAAGAEGEVKRKVEALHIAMLEAHALYGTGEDLTGAGKEALHAALAEVHEQHEDLMSTLTSSQRAQLVRNARRQMSEGEGGYDAGGMHDKMRLHLDRSGSHGPPGEPDAPTHVEGAGR